MKTFNLFQSACLLGLATILLPACGPTASSSNKFDQFTPGDKPDGTHFTFEENQSGKASNMQVLSISYGRLIDEVYDTADAMDPLDVSTMVNTSLVVNPTLVSDGTDFLFEVNPVTRLSRLTILHNYGTAAYDAAFAKLMTGMDEALDKSLDPSVLPPYTMVPRNSAIVIRFSDLLDPATINSQTIKVLAGYQPTTPFFVRVIPDPNFGGIANGTFYSTRVIVDPVINNLDSEDTGLSINSLGFPSALNTGSPNLAIRIPTVLAHDSQQFTLLRNLSQHALEGVGSAPFDYASKTVDVIRALRTGGLTEKVGDLNNGFLSDDTQPQWIGRQPVTITDITVDPGVSGGYLLDYTYTNLACSQAPRVGDVIEQLSVIAEITALGAVSGAGVVDDAKIRLLTESSGVPFPGGASIESPWDPMGPAAPVCFVEFDPAPGSGVNAAVDPNASVIIRFSEPMDPALITPYDSFVVSPRPFDLDGLAITDFVVGEVTATPDMRDFRFIPTASFRHSAAASEQYYVHLFDAEGLVDLSGNALANPLGSAQITFTMDPTASENLSSGRAFRFATYFDDEDFGNVVDDDGNGAPDLRGQFVADTVRGTISPRPVDRFSQTIDRNQYVPNWMTPMSATSNGGFLGTVQEPLNPLGCKMMSLWRYFDMGLDVVDEAFMNIDVEHVNWAPIGSNVLAEYFPQFQMSMATTLVTPDESWAGPPNTLIFPASGLDTTLYSNNILADPNNSLTIVHDKEDGYFIDPIKKFQTDENTFLFPYPMNTNKPLEEYKYWTYRDTSIETRGGVDPLIGLEPPVRFDQDDLAMPTMFGSAEFILTEPDPGADPPIEEVNMNLIASDGLQVPAFGLPLLLEYRCYSSDSTVGLNRLDTSLAMHPAWAQGVNAQNALASLPGRPFFRIFSAGGTDTAEQTVYKDPDLEILPTGGYHYEDASIATKGGPTAIGDNIYYMGQLDFVVRISRVHTTWHEIQDPGAQARYFEPVLEPRNDQQPQGTGVQIHFRGATAITLNNPGRVSAISMNVYGDVPNGFSLATMPPSGLEDTLVFGDPANDNNGITGATAWFTDVADMQGQRFFQIRMTFLNNAAAGTFPELSTLAVANAAQ